MNASIRVVPPVSGPFYGMEVGGFIISIFSRQFYE